MSRPLSATMYGKYDMPSMDFKKLRKILISACRKHVVARQGPPHLRLETISARSGPYPVSRKPPPESSVPGDNLPRGSRRNQLRRGHGSPPVLSEVFSSLALRCALQRVQTVPAAIHSGRIPPTQPTSHGDGRLSQPPHHTGHGPFRTRPPSSIKNPFCP